MPIKDALMEAIYLQQEYSDFISKNEKRLIDDFCDKIKEEKVGDLNLEDYTRYIYWKKISEKDLNNFFAEFKKNTKDYDIPYGKFCEFIWSELVVSGEDLPPNLKEVKRILDNSRNNNLRGEA